MLYMKNQIILSRERYEMDQLREYDIFSTRNKFHSTLLLSSLSAKGRLTFHTRQDLSENKKLYAYWHDGLLEGSGTRFAWKVEGPLVEGQVS